MKIHSHLLFSLGLAELAISLFCYSIGSLGWAAIQFLLAGLFIASAFMPPRN